MSSSIVKRVQRVTRKMIGKGTGPGTYRKSNGYWDQRRRKNTADLTRTLKKYSPNNLKAKLARSK